MCTTETVESSGGSRSSGNRNALAPGDDGDAVGRTNRPRRTVAPEGRREHGGKRSPRWLTRQIPRLDGGRPVAGVVDLIRRLDDVERSPVERRGGSPIESLEAKLHAAVGLARLCRGAAGIA